MGLSLESKSGGSSEGYLGDGIYVDEARVVKVVNGTKEEAARGFEYDIALTVDFKLEKNGWDRKLTIGGNFKKDKQTGKIEDWGGAFKVRDFLKACNVAGDLDEHGQPTDVQMNNCKDAIVLVLTYPNKKGGRSTWNNVTYATRSKEAFKDYFLKGATNPDESRRYPKNYQQSADPFDAQPVSEEMQKAIKSSDISTDVL